MSYELQRFPLFTIENAYAATAHALDHVTQVVSQKRLYFWNPRFLLAYSLYKFYWATTTIKGRILSSRPMLKPSSGEKIVPSKWVRKMVVLEENRGRNVRFWFRDPQKTLLCAEPRRLTYFFVSKSVRASRLLPFSRTKKPSHCAEGPEITHEQNRNPLDKFG